MHPCNGYNNKFYIHLPYKTCENKNVSLDFFHLKYWQFVRNKLIFSS